MTCSVSAAVESMDSIPPTAAAFNFLHMHPYCSLRAEKIKHEEPEIDNF